jgi:hypothetical protein
MAALTLFEAAKLHSGDVFRQGVIETIGTYGSVVSVIPFLDINGAAYSYNQEEALPGVAFRGVNESFTPNTGVVNPQTETLKIFGGQIDVDKFIVATQGEDQRDMQERMKMKAMALDWGKTFIKGDSASNPREFDGLQVRLTGSQLIDAGSTSGGDALSLLKLDELIDAVDDPTHLFMNRTMKRLLSASTRNTAVSGYITHTVDEFGRRVMMYNDLPIVVVDEDASRNQILPFTEANPGGGAAASTSIYCASIGDGQLMGIQNGTMDASDLGLLDAGNVYRTDVEWYNGIVLLGDKSAARLQGIKNAAVTA